MNINPMQLNDAIDTYRRFLPNQGLQTFDISGLDRIGIPVYMTSLQDHNGFSNNGVGYGNSSTEALVGALGELSETYHVHNALKIAPSCEAVSYNSMINRFGANQVIDPLSLCLSAGYIYNDDLPLRWVAVNRLDDSVRCWAPREAVAYSGFSYETHSTVVELRNGTLSARLFPPITCGLGAGLDFNQALSHGVLELLQRDGNCTAFRAMDQGIDIELDVIESTEIKTTLAYLKSLGLNVRAKLASTEFELVNLYVIAESVDETCVTNEFPLLVTACGEAVHINREQALRKALHEFISSRSRKTFMHGPTANISTLAPAEYVRGHLETAQFQNEEPKALIEMANWLSKSQAELSSLLSNTVFSSKRTVKFTSLPNITGNVVFDSKYRLSSLADRLAAHNISIYFFNGSPNGPDAPKVVKAIAPGLEGETLSYWRVGGRGAKRLLDRQSTLISQDLPQAQHLLVPLRSSVEEKIGGQVFFSVPEWEKTLNGHYPLYREPAPHTAQKFLKSSKDMK